MTVIKRFFKLAPKKQTVFTTAEIKQILNINNTHKIKMALYHAVKKKEIVRISNGLFAINDNYSRLELGNKLRSPSYLSLYSVLQKEGLVFQPYTSLFYISNRSEKITIENQQFIYRKIKDRILLNPKGINRGSNLTHAKIERAICDKIYLDGDEHFDNLSVVDWKFMKHLNMHVYERNPRISNFIKKHT